MDIASMVIHATKSTAILPLYIKGWKAIFLTVLSESNADLNSRLSIIIPNIPQAWPKDVHNLQELQMVYQGTVLFLGKDSILDPKNVRDNAETACDNIP